MSLQATHVYAKKTYVSRLLWATLLTYILSFSMVYAQSSAQLHQYDAQIEYYADKGMIDSLFYYGEKKATLARSADSLGDWLAVKKKMSDADAFFDSTQVALAFCQKVAADRWRPPCNAEEWELLMRLEGTMGWHCKELSQTWQSIQHYEAANGIYERFRFPDFDVVTYIYKALGNNYTRLDENEKALVIHHKALFLGGSSNDLAGTYLNIGKAYWNWHDFATAEVYYQQGLALSGVSDELKSDLWCNLSITQMEQKHYAQATRSIESASKLLNRSTQNKEDRCYECHSNIAHSLASILLRTGKPKEALKQVNISLKDAQVESSQRTIGKINDTRARILIQLGQYELAIIAANNALSTVLPSFKPSKLSENPPFASFYEENTIAEALETKAKAATALFHQTNDVVWLQIALECYDLAWKSSHKLRESYQYTSAKLDLQRFGRERDESAISIARLLYEKTKDAQYIQKGFEITERNKSALLADALHDNLFKQALAAQDTLLDQITLMRRQRALYEKDLLLEPNNPESIQWRNQKDALQKQITDLEHILSGKYGLSNANQSPIFALNSQGNTNKGNTLVAYFITEKVVNIFVLGDHQAPSWSVVPNDESLKALVRSYLRFFAAQDAILGDPETYFRVAAQLASMLLPASAYSGEALLIVPDGFAQFIPFEALLTAMPTNSTTLRNAPYLIRQKPVAYAWSVATWQQQQQIEHRPNRYLLGVAPRFESGQRGLAPLFSGKNEWETSQGPHGNKLMKEKANYQGFIGQCEQYGIIHLNTHAFADNPSRIELFDQPLYLPEIFALSLQADLVVLSACQTGLGTDQKGEGVMSLARAFAHAGAACIISSLWSVNDRSTSRLFEYFYEGIGAQKSTRAALQAAKLRYIDDMETSNSVQSPYFWAGFIMVGDDRMISGQAGVGSYLLWILGLVVLGLGGWGYWKRRKG